ncbi:uncharacterized protein F21D5.5 [Lutzomyia longipalpis]|uniref:uncharacterized protein F21D5.5 n=1 Tax=Lutzomyia longipalpis TaxID=7200 RepID=UPI002483BD6F|nr:uncharacterized protein F21D5.5 [Lutzomyia longipalpis]XP_055693813.1 uncharacterized protein F21D5.5 [Lutzomyia longipalpis]
MVFVYVFSISRLFLRTMASKPAGECLLKSINGKIKDVKLPQDPTFIGRSPETEIQDQCCSRKQVKLTTNFSKRIVECVALGMNPSSLNGQVMSKGMAYEAKDGDIIEVVPGKYSYKIIFTSEEKSSKATPGNSKESHPKANESSGKRKLSGDPEESSSSASKIPRTDATVAEFLEAPDGKLIYIWTSKGVISRSKIASYDIDGTIITTKSGNVFPKNLDDWKLAFSEVPGVLKKNHADGFKVVFFTNQASIAKGKLKIEDFIGKVKRIVEKINIPVQVFISTGKGIYRKPMVGMWRLLEERFNDGVKIDMKESFFVGDAAGRAATKGFQKRKKDHSCSDRLMALNLNLRFATPEEHFLRAKALPWERPEFDPKNYVPPKQLLQPPGASLHAANKEMIVMVGSPGSGKSAFVQANYQGKYEIVSRDKLGTWQKCVAAAEAALQCGKSVIVDNTNPDIESRKRYTELAKKLKCPCRCFQMATTPAQARHQIAFRELVDPSHAPINDMVLNSFKSKFKDPTTAEGFSGIVKVNVIPKFKDKKHQDLFHMYLLDK